MANKSIIQEFKEFAVKGNVIDLAVGIIIGGAFGKITTSLVGDIIMPPLGLLLAKVDFANLFINLSGEPVKSLEQAKSAGIPVLAYGQFINNIIDFLIVAFVVFLLIKVINNLKRTEEKKVAKSKDCPYCFSAISLKATRCPNCTSQLKTGLTH